MASVEVFIPCYNYSRYLPDCVASVQHQEMRDLRIVIIDNASTDDSLAVAQQLSATDPRVSVVCHSQNLGPQASFNEAIERASADYMLILCADDLLVPEALPRACDALEKEPNAVMAIGADLKIEDGALVGAVPPHPLAPTSKSGERFIDECCETLGFTLALGAVLVRTDIQKAVGAYSRFLQYTDDLEMALRLARRGTVVEFAGALGIRREHEAQMSARLFPSDLVRLAERKAAFESFLKACAPSKCTGRWRRIAMRRLAETACWTGISLIARGRPRAALEMLAYGMRLDARGAAAIPAGLISHFRRAAVRSDVGRRCTVPKRLNKDSTGDMQG